MVKIRRFCLDTSGIKPERTVNKRIERRAKAVSQDVESVEGIRIGKEFRREIADIKDLSEEKQR